MKWQEALRFMAEDRRKYGLGTPEPAPDIEEFVEFAESVHGLYIPGEFTEFWKVQNGLEFDGDFFYHTDAELIEDIHPLDPATNNAIIATNIIWHELEEQRPYTFLGDGNIDWYVYEIATGKYMVLDKPGGAVMEEYDSFDGFFSAVLSRKVEEARMIEEAHRAEEA